MNIKISFIINKAIFKDDIANDGIIFEDMIKDLLGEKLTKIISNLKIEEINE